MLQKRLKRLARAGVPETFITLTSSDRTSLDRDEAAQKLRRGWNILVKRWKRAHQGQRLPYIAVLEATKAGRPHLHILARVPWLSQKWLSQACDALLGAPIVWIERITNPAKMAAYVAKYIGKAPHKFIGCKRYWRSRDWIKDLEQWAKDNEKSAIKWIICNYNLNALANKLVDDGFDVSWVRHDYIKAEPRAG